jgi:hypothetical protein
MPKFALALSVALSSGALLVALFARGEPAPPPPAAPVASPTWEADLARLEGRVQALEAEVKVLRSQLSSGAPQGRGVEVVQAPEALASEVAQLRQALADLQAGEALSAPEGREYLKSLVKEAQADLSRERERARALDIVSSEEMARGERKERWKRFVAEAGLTWAQEQDLDRLVKVEEEKRSELFQKVKEGSLGFGEMRRELGSARRATDAAMAAQLSPEQKAKYDTVRLEEGRTPGRPGRGGLGPR